VRVRPQSTPHSLSDSQGPLKPLEDCPTATRLTSTAARILCTRMAHRTWRHTQRAASPAACLSQQHRGASQADARMHRLRSERDGAHRKRPKPHRGSIRPGVAGARTEVTKARDSRGYITITILQRPHVSATCSPRIAPLMRQHTPRSRTIPDAPEPYEPKLALQSIRSDLHSSRTGATDGQTNQSTN
jgi:hypothetical protein